ncbi:SDR family NAD(P)-dependent oxidoreductase [Bradyrhizobium sp. CSS354]|uniref:SDR family NAD(P)-dependent oxidoreductase n=1 Tax=Bradyrhizobium sp. CSS354 TaxID=2699172 RepID=UPI0023AF9878|nr:SDR family NAD(P)-dependent oxidoreductase [Bradyrhizobium sp. CSS354]
MSDVKDKVVLILGCAGGIGSVTAKDLASKGAKIAVADINEAKAEDVARAIRNTGGESRVYPVDVTQKEQVRATVAKVAQDFGSLDTLINCAGIMFVRPLIEINTVEWETTVDLNIKGGAVGNRGCSAGFHAPAARAYHQSQFHPRPQSVFARRRGAFGF